MLAQVLSPATGLKIACNAWHTSEAVSVTELQKRLLYYVLKEESCAPVSVGHKATLQLPILREGHHEQRGACVNTPP